MNVCIGKVFFRRVRARATLNIDYKILAKVLAKRLQSVLPLIINCDQQGYVKNRFISINIRQIQDVIDYVECLNIDGAVLCVDFKKPFDTVECNFMHNALNKFEFRKDFLLWVQILSINISSSVINNSWK